MAIVSKLIKTQFPSLQVLLLSNVFPRVHPKIFMTQLSQLLHLFHENQLRASFSTAAGGARDKTGRSGCSKQHQHSLATLQQWQQQQGQFILVRGLLSCRKVGMVALLQKNLDCRSLAKSIQAGDWVVRFPASLAFGSGMGSLARIRSDSSSKFSHFPASLSSSSTRQRCFPLK